MAAPLAELTAQAQTLSTAGDLTGARAVLDRVLRDANADPRRATADLAIAAALHARVLIALGDPQAARLWAAFAHAAEERLHGRRDERTIAAAATHAAVLQQIGQHGRAALVYHDLVGELARLDGPAAPRVLAAEADLAIAEHAAGHCGTARARLSRAWRHHRDVHGDAAPAGIKMLARLGAMERECGRDQEAAEHLELAQELSARYLPADHPLARQATRLAGAGPTGRHTCGRREQSDGTPFRPFPRRPTVPDPGPASPSPYPAKAPGMPPPDDRPTDPSGTVYPVEDDMPAPDNRPTDPNGTVYQQPLYLSDLNRLPGDLTGRHARADTPPPLPGHPAPDYGDDGRPAPVGTALPVRLDRQPRSRPANPLLLAAALAGAVAAAAAVVILTLPDADGATGPQAAPSANPPAAGAPGGTASGPVTESTTAAEPGAPQNVRLRDDGDSVSLQWVYPRGARGPVHISGGRTGEEPKKFQELPGGAADYVVYNLNERANYCFRVAVEYGADRIADSAPVCTRR
ncbi:fibronectin type III domain-containing protein [Actinoplanes sp. DH11]|uniref:fibronectin type III domain-containing protein n=1 Tax=Actinoplanes sp. DH11 TaxID=2857011 RepID=UPI001E396DD0|nr:fibronectin type III domain-containing protein [Actinoplanes sp. DH11]